MTLDTAARLEIERELANAKKLPEFSGEKFYLTYYLSGRPEALSELVEPLTAASCTNLTDSEGGFMYPKQPSAFDADEIILLIEDVRSICEAHAVDVLHVDLDTSVDPERTAFQTLIEFDC